MSQNRLLATLLAVLAVLVLVVGGLSALLLVWGGDGEGGGGGTGIGTGSGSTSAPASGRLRLAGSDPVTLDPHLAGDATSAEYIVEVFGGLVTITPDLEIVPDLAESFDVSTDGMTYTFTLREGARFHTGRAVTAEDVKWSLERAASRELRSPTAMAYLGDIVGARERFFEGTEMISGIQVLDDRTVQITIDAPKPYFLAKLTYPTAFVVDRQQVESNPRNWTRRPNGTGPFKLAEWRLGERIVLQANPDYVLGAPHLSEVVYLLSGGSMLTRFENNELDVAGISIADIERARDPNSTIGARYQVAPEFAVSYIAFNTNVAPFDDPHVRRAMGMAIDRRRIAEVTFSNMLAPATGILMPGLPGYTEGDKTLPFDPDAARAELALSPYADNMPPIVITEVGAGAEARTDTQAFLEQWRTVLGLNVEIRQTDFGTFLADQDAGVLQAFNAGWIMDYPDPESILDLKFHSDSTLNDVNYSNPQVDDLLGRARIEADPAARMALYQQAEEIILSEAAWLPLYFSLDHTVVQPEVSGWVQPPMVVPRLRYVEVSR